MSNQPTHTFVLIFFVLFFRKITIWQGKSDVSRWLANKMQTITYQFFFYFFSILKFLRKWKPVNFYNLFCAAWLVWSSNYLGRIDFLSWAGTGSRHCVMKLSLWYWYETTKSFSCLIQELAWNFHARIRIA